MIPKSALSALNKLVEKWRNKRKAGTTDLIGHGMRQAECACADELSAILQSIEPTEARAECSACGGRGTFTDTVGPGGQIGQVHCDVCDGTGFASPLPKAETQEAVAWYDLPMANIELADAIVQEWQRRVESGSPKMPWTTGELVEFISKLRPNTHPAPEAATIDATELDGIARQIQKLREDGFAGRMGEGSYADKELEAIGMRVSALRKHASEHAGKQGWVSIEELEAFRRSYEFGDGLLALESGQGLRDLIAKHKAAAPDSAREGEKS